MGFRSRIHNAGCGGGVGVDEVRIRIDRIVGAFYIAVTQQGLDDREGGDSLAVALQLDSPSSWAAWIAALMASTVFLSDFRMIRLTLCWACRR